MSAKPRVHEIATEFGVAVKTVLRMLKEDGEVVKGPSSPVETVVAERVRARLAGGPEGAAPRPVPSPPGTLWRAEPRPSPAPDLVVPAVEDAALPIDAAAEQTRPVPSPPGTRWLAREPFVPYTQPEPVALAEQVLPELVEERQAGEGARGAGAARKESRAHHDQDAVADPPQAKRAEQRPVFPSTDWRSRSFVPPQSTPATRSARPLREGAAAARLSAERTEGEARQMPPVADEEILTEEESRDRARRAVVARSDTQWNAYRIVKTERQLWLAAGLGHDRAHIPRMCRIFDARGWGISPASFGVRLPNGRTVLQEFEAGSNIVQVLDLLSVVRKREFNGSFDARASVVVPVLRDHPPERPRIGPPPLGVEPAGVPKIADYLLGFTRPSPDERAIDTFNREVKGFDRTGRPGPLVKLYAEAHGVFNDPDLTHTLLQNVPMHVSGRQPRLPFTNLINDALRERQFYYLSATATEAVDEDADRRIPVPEEHELPTPTGFALLRGSDAEGVGAVRILLWSHGANELTAALLSMSDLIGGLVEHPVVVSARTGSGATDHALALVAAIAVATLRPSSDDVDEDVRRAPQHLGGSIGRPRAAKRTVDETGEPVDLVSLIYAPGEEHFEQEPPTSTGRKAEKRWVVRGHWRQQWYSSRGERHPLWIKAHEAGADEGELLLRDRVKVTRSRSTLGTMPTRIPQTEAIIR